MNTPSPSVSVEQPSSAEEFEPKIGPALDPRTSRLLDSPILPLILSLAWPNILIMVANSATGLIELWFVARLGTDALAAMSLVTPLLILMQNMSLGAMGGGISSAVARALGSGARDKADAVTFHALVINTGLGVCFAIALLSLARPLYLLLGGEGTALHGAVLYSNIVFAGLPFLWASSALASIIRGTGNMIVPGKVICGGALLLVPLSPCLIFGLGPLPAMGLAGGGAALLVYFVASTAALGWYVATGRNITRLRPTRLRWSIAKEILAVGAVGIVNTVQMNLNIVVTTAFIASSGGSAAVAGFGTGTRLEYLLPPLAFGFGAPMVALVGSNIGAGKPQRALKIAAVGGFLAFLLTGSIGIAAALYPEAWIRLFDTTPAVIAIGSKYLRTVGPMFGFYGLGLALFFASQGAGRLGWPLFAAFLRVLITLGAGGLLLKLTGSVTWLFAAYSAALFVYGIVVAAAIGSGAWFRSKVR